MARRTLLLDPAADREPSPRRSAGGWFWKLLLGAGAAAAGLSAYAAYSIHRPRRRDLLDDYTVTPFELQTPHKDVEFITEDDVKLRGWLFENPGDPRVVIGASGRWGSKSDLIGIGTFQPATTSSETSAPHAILFAIRYPGRASDFWAIPWAPPSQFLRRPKIRGFAAWSPTRPSHPWAA
jgi:hypothetical protein